MPNIKSNLKSSKKSLKVKKIRSSKKTNLKKRIKEAKLTGSSLKVNLAFKAIDSKCSQGIIKKNKANRLKSKLAKHVNKLVQIEKKEVTEVNK